LLEWLITDDAWEQHASWYPLCVYVRHIKGDTFVNECQRQRSRTETDSVRRINEDTFVNDVIVQEQKQIETD